MRRALWLGVVGVLGCGQQAVDGHYRGEPLFTIEGTVSVTSDALGADKRGELRVALFWARPGSATGPIDSVTAVEQEVGAATSFPARVTLTVHEPPAAELIETSPTADGRLALAVLLVYLDMNGDGRWNRGAEDLVGSAADALLVFAPEGVGGGRFGALSQGFHLLRGAGGLGACAATLRDAAPSDVPIVVDMRFPAGTLGDVDCDGGSHEWSGACPAPEVVWSSCRNGAAPADLCATCDSLLWSQGSPDTGCDAWRESCEGFADSDECESAWEQCRQEGADDEGGGTADAVGADSDVQAEETVESGDVATAETDTASAEIDEPDSEEPDAQEPDAGPEESQAPDTEPPESP